MTQGTGSEARREGIARPVVLAGAAALFALVTVVRFASGNDPGQGISFLYTLPVALLAVEYGVRGGLLAAALAISLLALWDLSEEANLGAVGYATRGAGLALLGGLVGYLSRARAAAETRTSRWFAMSNDMLSESTLDGRFTHVNDQWEKQLGYTADELTERPYVEFIHPDDVAPTFEVAGALAEGPTDVVDFENRYRVKSGGWKWLLWSARSDGQRIYAVAKDITERKLAEEEHSRKLEHSEAVARTDSLTGVPNRRAWDEELRRQLAKAGRDGTSVAVVLLDLDHFKAFNDRHGHPAGDALLRDAGMAWRLALRVSDFLARYGGEEFAAVLPFNGAGLKAAVERLRRATPEGVTASAGLAVWDGEEQTEALVARADAALYEAKRAGRDRLVVDTRA